MRTLPTVLLAAAFGFASVSASAQIVRTIARNGPSSELYDVVILGDGYTAAEEARFNSDAQAIVDGFRNDPTKFPYDAYFHCYNFHTVFRASAQSGASKPPQNIFVNNAYGARYWFSNVERCLYIANTSLAAADAALAPDSDGRVIVLVNDSKYGGCAGVFSVGYNGPLMWEVQAHEWGHSFGNLADEYGGSGAYTGGEPSAPNVTRSPTGAKWSLWLNFSGQYSVVGAYQGAGGWGAGLYRPETDCLMRALQRRFCTVCREQFVKNFNRHTAMIGGPKPPVVSLTALQHGEVRFSFENRLAGRPHDLEWRVGAGPFRPGGDSFTWEVGTSPPGPHTVSVRLRDTSPEVRNDPGDLTLHTRTWTVNVLPSTPGSVVPMALAASRGTATMDALVQGAGSPRTYMLGIRASQLAGVPPGSRINGISFRPAASGANPSSWPPVDATWADYEIAMGNALPIDSWTATFSANFSQPPIAVRSGPMVLEAGSFSSNPALPPPQANPWGSFHFDFQEGFTYAGGDLGVLLTHDGSDQSGAALLLDATVSSPLGHGRALAAPSFRAGTATTTSAEFVVVRVHHGYGSGCRDSRGRLPQLVLGGSAPGGDVAFALSNGPPGAPALYALGVDPTSLPLPDGCTLLTTPVILLPASLSPRGRASLDLPVPPGAAGPVHVQGFLLDPGASRGFAATNGVSLRL